MHHIIEYALEAQSKKNKESGIDKPELPCNYSDNYYGDQVCIRR